MPRQSVFGIVHRKNPPGAEVLYGPLQIGRRHVDIAPILAVLAVFEHGDIQIRKLACDVGEMGIVPAVAAEENPLRRSFDDERSPQRPVRPKRTSGKVPRGTAIYRKAAAERSLFAPIELRDPLRIETPIFEILAHTQRADDTARAVAQLRYRAVVEMVYVPTPASIITGIVFTYKEKVPTSLWLWLSLLNPPLAATNIPFLFFI